MDFKSLIKQEDRILDYFQCCKLLAQTIDPKPDPRPSVPNPVENF
jgi:hypothetical protein